jgi:Flp pilus assembly protein TadD
MNTHRRISGRPAVPLLAAVSFLAAVPFLAACGDRRNDRTVAGSRPAATAPGSPQPSSGSEPPSSQIDSPQPGAGTGLPVPAPVPSNEPIVPPTPQETRAAWSEGVALYESGDFENAALRLTLAASGRPDDPYVQYLLGLALWKSGQLEESEAALRRSAALDGRSERTFVNLARVRLDRKDPRGALEAAGQALSLNPASAQGLHQRGRALDALNRGDEAREALRQARQADHASGYIANTLGYLLLRQGRAEEAVVELEAARESLPQVAYIRNNLGVAYERLGEIDKAVVEFQAAVDAGDPDGKAAGSLARLDPIRQRLLARRAEVPDPPASDLARADNGAGEEPPDR